MDRQETLSLFWRSGVSASERYAIMYGNLVTKDGECRCKGLYLFHNDLKGLKWLPCELFSQEEEEIRRKLGDIYEKYVESRQSEPEDYAYDNWERILEGVEIVTKELIDILEPFVKEHYHTDE